MQFFYAVALNRNSIMWLNDMCRKPSMFWYVTAVTWVWFLTKNRAENDSNKMLTSHSWSINSHKCYNILEIYEILIKYFFSTLPWTKQLFMITLIKEESWSRVIYREQDSESRGPSSNPMVGEILSRSSQWFLNTVQNLLLVRNPGSMIYLTWKNLFHILC